MIAKTTIKLPTYSCKLQIVVVPSVAAYAEKVYKKYKIVDSFGAEAEGALIMVDISNYFLVLHKNFLTHNTIAHEIYHAAVRITEDRDVTDEEAQAWLTGYITEVVYKYLDKKNIAITHG